ncbi:MAG: thymidine phosphorylase [Myxococcales bacterium]|nr:thymidine phosphorylase [Myxococcales bacterium]
MRAVDIIRKKREGLPLTAAEIEWFVAANLRGEAADYQLGALLMAIFLRGLSPDEVGWLTRAFMNSGVVLDLSRLAGTKVDKHSTGGVGDKVSLILAPLAACAGLYVPMIAGRGLGHTGGTIDKLEAIPGYNPFLPLADFLDVVERVGCAIIGQTGELCPADRKWYALRDVTGTVESIDLITASIMSKKLAAGLDALVLDVKVGSGAFMPTLELAEKLARSLVRVGVQMGKPVRAVLTDMNQPLGREIGNANEVAESIEILQGRGDRRLLDVTLALGAHLLAAGGVEKNAERATARLRGYLENGQALARFVTMVAAQGGDTRVIEHPERLARAPLEKPFVATRSGYLTAVATTEVGYAAMLLGAGRERAEDKIDFGAGITVNKQLGDRVEAGEPLCFLRAGDENRLEAGRRRLAGVFTVGDMPPAPAPLVHRIVAEE